MTGSARIIRGNALALPIADETVDLIVTSPPYFGLRSYQDGGGHYEGQIGDEATPAEFVDALIAATREMVRVLKPSGSIWVNLGDSYAGAPAPDAKIGRGQRERRTRVEQFTREDAAWLAGVIDSDGSIGVHINKQAEGRAPSFVPWVRIGQMRPEVVEHAANICGTGKVMQDGRGVWNWAASAQQARWVLERIHPWLLIKKRQAWAAIELARHVETRNAKGSWRQLTDDDIAYRHRLRDAVMAWNQGLLDDYQAPDPGAVSLPIYPLAPKAKSLRDIPHAYAQECVGRLGLIKRAEVCWAKPNGLPESVTDRVRRSHEFWFHFTKSPRYYSAVDEIREVSSTADYHARYANAEQMRKINGDRKDKGGIPHATNPLGKLPGSVWTIPTQPLQVPAHLGVDHFAAFPMEFPRRIIRGWSPAGVCTECGEGRRPIVSSVGLNMDRPQARRAKQLADDAGLTEDHFAALLSVGVSDTGRGKATQSGTGKNTPEVYALADEARAVLGGYSREYLLRRPTGLAYVCACTPYTDHPGTGESSGPSHSQIIESGRASIGTFGGPHGSAYMDRPKVGPTREYHFDQWTPAPTTPGVVLDPFGGTGTTALMAKALGRTGIHVDMSADYCRLAEWRTTDPGQMAAALQVEKPETVHPDQLDLFSDDDALFA